MEILERRMAYSKCTGVIFAASGLGIIRILALFEPLGIVDLFVQSNMLRRISPATTNQLTSVVMAPIT
jgi:hypothetical protein